MNLMKEWIQGPIIGQLVGKHDPRKVTSSDLYNEAMHLEEKLITIFVPLLRENIAPRISQNITKRTVYGKIIWEEWPREKVKRARTYPYK